MINILLAVGGIALVIFGADRLVAGSVGIAERMRISQIVIGLTVVAMGTSAPELFVSIMSALAGTPDLAVGNIVGSNIFNTLVIVGVTALVSPMAISRKTVRRDLPICVLAGCALAAVCADWQISRIEAAILFAAFIAYMVYTVREGRKNAPEADDAAQGKPMKIWAAILFVLLGFGCLIGGGQVFVIGATGIAQSLGVSDAIIGLTVVAGGTSLPELATCVAAARKGNSEIAIGNVIGSNVFNIFMIIGTTGLITPMTICGVTLLDMGVMAIGGFVLWTFSYTKLTVERWEGAVLTAAYIGYTWWLISNL
ncbi:MAG: calcium/sodium antiporter [Bacteroidales bacterium]|nr:calcium/sodium antiporter [Bacteroidales bacterium]